MSLEEDLSCPVCTEIFRDPVLLSCGHSFCRQCINDHWSSSRSRTCPVCRQLSPQTPVSNLSLRNTCESYLRETEGDGGHECQIHGETIQLFCQTDQQLLCATCKKLEHKWHKTQPLQQAVQQRKEKLKEALRPAKKSLWSLQNGEGQYAKISDYNQSQVQQTERRIREEFKKINCFLKKEEEGRIAALNEEKKEKKGRIEKRTKASIHSLSDKLREVEERMKDDDDVTFLQNYDSIMNRAKCALPDPELSLESLIDVPKHLGNLKYQVWEKMKNICPFYPVILNPNTAPPDVSISEDLTTVTSCVYRQDKSNPLPLHSNRMVLGSVGYINGVQMWEIEVGNSRHWTLGVCLGSAERSVMQSLNPANGFWGFRRDGDVYKFLNTTIAFNLKTSPKVVRVKLEDCFDQKEGWKRNVSYFDASCNCCFGCFQLPGGIELIPFVMPEKHSGPLRVVPSKVTLTTQHLEQEIFFPERHYFLPKVRWEILFLVFFSLVVLCVSVIYHRSI